ncbi:MAG TPA: NAD(P)/FAD-dependent oxidoreductase [Solirubrobacteraceae bacterium]
MATEQSQNDDAPCAPSRGQARGGHAPTSKHRRRVVIVGGGFGGLTAARKLRGADVEVTLVDKLHHHLFQPLLYQVALGALSTGECASPIRAGLKRSSNATVLMAEATGIDVEKRQLLLDRGDVLDYDSLIVSCGAETSYFGKDDWQDASYGMKTLSDAVELRNRIYGAFEEAERCEDPAERAKWMTFVVIGGGPTGIEIAGELSIIAAHTMKRQFTRIQAADAKVILLDAGERVAAAFSERLSRKVAKELASLGVEVHVGARVSDIDARGVTASIAGADTRFDSRTVIWAAGVQPVPFVKALAEATGAPTDRGGRIQIESDLTVPGHPEISAIGDITSLPGPGERPLPGLATVAIQQARHVAKGIGEGAPAAKTPFHYLDKGALAVVGRGKAVCEIRGLEFSGRPAFFLYLTIHMYYLSGGGQGRRLKVLLDWISARLGKPQNPVINSDLDSVERLPRGARL